MIDLVVVVTVFGLIFYLYQTYGSQVIVAVFGEQPIGIFIRDIPIYVSVADTVEERQHGLSDITSLPERNGMLFVFDREGSYGFWMKDMLIPLDILWIDDELRVVHIERNVRPDSYPTMFSSPEPARFVLEVNAFFVSTFNIHEGDKVSIPANALPPDLRP